jgi:general secretion pathway protein K
MTIRRNRGSALLAVLWLSAALSAIAFSIATTVRTETERTALHGEDVRAYYLAAGAVDRAMLYIQWGPGSLGPDGKPRYFRSGMPRLHFSFPSGEADVAVIPETAKVDLNQASPELLFRLLLALGVSSDHARELTLAIVDWRTASPTETPLDQFYLSLVPSFRSRHASFQEIEELLLLRGMTTELFYGGYTHGDDDRLVPHGGLRDCVSVYGVADRFEVNTAHPAVLLAAGLPPETVSAIVAMRQRAPILEPQQLEALGASAQHLRIGGESIFSLRATARLRLQDGRLSDTVRSVEALVKRHENDKDVDVPYHTLRWYDNVWAQ